MLPNNSPEGTPQAPAGGSEQPTSTPSGEQGNPLPEYVTALQSQIADLTGQLRGLQSGTDRQIGQVRGDIKRILELKEQGLNESQIHRELYIDQLMSSGQAGPAQQNAPVQPPAGSGQTNTGLDVDGVIASLKFEPNDPAIAALKIKHGGNPQALLQAAADLRLSQLQSPNPTPGTSLPQQGAALTGMTPQQADEKLAQLENLYKNYSTNKGVINNLESELKAAGVLQK